MKSIILKSEQLNLPVKLAKKLKGKEIKLVETKEGILIKPVEDPISAARGCLQRSHFSTQVYLQYKKEEKELER
ncbi:MAG: hypothetical protein HZA78_07700 [Candidatus Schekmanbacteria bacterium]|nr:hypothetical protein [Candidatus Schekmanbacteria bacterium]